MSKYISKEIVLNNIVLPEGVSILYSTWKILDEEDNIVLYIPRDNVNLTSRVFNNVFEVGKKYKVIMSLVRTDGPTVETKPLEVVVFSGEDIYELYPIPSVVDTPIISMDYISVDTIPNSNIKFKSSDLEVYGNATHDSSSWWLTDDTNEVIWSKLNSQEHKTSITIDDVVLNPNRLYTISVVYKATNRDLSGVGSLTFKPTDFSVLDLNSNLDNIYYGFNLETRLKDVPYGMTSFTYSLLEEGVVEVSTDTNTTGIINSNTYILKDNINRYLLRLSMVVNGEIIGWKELWLYPKNLIVPSSDLKSNDVNYSSDVEVKRINSSLYNTDNYTTDSNPKGKSYQLPNGEYLMLKDGNEIGRYIIDIDNESMSYLGKLDLPNITLNQTINSFTSKLFDSGDLILVVGAGTVNVIHYKFNANSNKYDYIKTYNITGFGDIMYTDLYKIGNYIVFNTGGTPSSMQRIYAIDLNTDTLELILSAPILDIIEGSLLYVSDNRLIYIGGYHRTNFTISTSVRIINITNSDTDFTFTTDTADLNLPNLSDNKILFTNLKNGNILACRKDLYVVDGELSSTLMIIDPDTLTISSSSEFKFSSNGSDLFNYTFISNVGNISFMSYNDSLNLITYK